jgi:hypothetical protein
MSKKYATAESGKPTRASDAGSPAAKAAAKVPKTRFKKSEPAGQKLTKEKKKRRKEL